MLLAAMWVAQQWIEHKSLDVYFMVNRDVHMLTVLKNVLLYFHSKDRHANAPEGFIWILKVQYQYEVNNLNTNDWSVFA